MNKPVRYVLSHPHAIAAVKLAYKLEYKWPHVIREELKRIDFPPYLFYLAATLQSGYMVGTLVNTRC